MKLLLLFTITSIFYFNFNSVLSQITPLPLKSNFIYYSFENEIDNEDGECLKSFFYSDKMGEALKLHRQINDKCSNMNKSELKLFKGLEQTMVLFMNAGMGFLPQGQSSCEGKGTSYILSVVLPIGKSALVSNNSLFQLLKLKKFKIMSQSISANCILKFTSNNEYKLIFTNFTVKYTGIRGTSSIEENLNLEDIYTELKLQGEQTGKMFDDGVKSIKLLDEIVKNCANIYHQEFQKMVSLYNLSN